MATPVPANLLPADLRQPSAVPADLLPEELRPKAAVVPMDLLPADLRAPQEKPPEAGFSAADIGISGVRGVLGVTKAITDVFGADNAASKKLEGYNKAMADLYTPERQKEIAYYEKKQQEAEASGKPVEEIKAALESCSFTGYSRGCGFYRS